MQSGISASRELQDAFKLFVSDPSQRALLAGIESEALILKATIPCQSESFYSDLAQLQPHLKPNEALYILLRLDPAPSKPPSFAAVTYVPNAAPVRQKTLFASTRLTLVRELGSEHFADTFFTTEADELTEQGWKRHEAHGEAETPLTEEERNLVDIKEAEATEVGGTARRGAGYGSSGVKIKAGAGVVEALSGLQAGSLVTLKIDTAETIVLAEEAHSVTPATLSSQISADEPRYSFYRHDYSGDDGASNPVIFIYTCPTSTKVKERMLYASSRRSAEAIATQDAGLTLSKKLEATDPSEITAQTIEDEFAAKQEQKSGFARPKRPGRR